MKKKSVFIILILLICLVLGVFVYGSSKCRAILTGDDNLSFDGYTYHRTTEDIGDYTETNHLICTTEFLGGFTIYEIKEYPDYEYVIVRSRWDAELYKRDR